MRIKNDFPIRKSLDSPAVWYCYMRGQEAVFLDRKDGVIKKFSTYDEAVLFAEKNMKLIDGIGKGQLQLGI